jgi:hypothetical protein
MKDWFFNIILICIETTIKLQKLQVDSTSNKVANQASIYQMATRSNAPASLKRWDKSGYVTGLTISKLQWGKASPH